jgi:hypothetical protein
MAMQPADVTRVFDPTVERDGYDMPTHYFEADVAVEAGVRIKWFATIRDFDGAHSARPGARAGRAMGGRTSAFDRRGGRGLRASECRGEACPAGRSSLDPADFFPCQYNATAVMGCSRDNNDTNPDVRT